MTVIRRATPEDLPELAEMVREFYAVDGHVHDGAVVAEALGPLLRDDLFGQVWMFDSGYAVVTWGYSIESGGRHALLDELYVRSRGTGVGGRVIEEVYEHCAGLGIPRMMLETERHNDRARRFYARHSFVEEDSVWFSRGDSLGHVEPTAVD
ncbi:GNAT family N-acetyltransferase [Umezawaea sp. Da 62-37]|uniref:GNAT family N-acetyltransferase n=1 Tax=Umezawaea sp. Da 62-37 TaxID=3075927 RepID=UPI0028F74E70|nr:GNAT family N-acetyltransferase [Umezawaea sp. Da 62-37]WNV87925.1 GNAT family N-acetyltransferase [Umezawaea sp. Da 62-37]